ncbi:MAG: excinuclease ABC subunit UvrB, partial [Proteobacteria bacterium]|nr:excinuclease ABC subunit UvrB [Pseudomonadota bacterium]
MDGSAIFNPPKRPAVPPLRPFTLHSEFQPAGDQPPAIAELVHGLGKAERDQVLLGVTGSGKTFTMAHAVQRVQRPALV